MRWKTGWKAGCTLGVLACGCAAGVPHAKAQMGTGEARVMVGSPTDPARAEDALLTVFEGEVMGVAKAMPADKFSFAPAPATFHANSPATFNGVRSFAQECTHITQANYLFFASFGGPKPSVDVRSLGNLTSKEEVVAALQASFDYAHQAVATITPANAFQSIEGVDGMHTRVTVASFAVAHGFDHYGQMVEYLRMNGVLPPGSK